MVKCTPELIEGAGQYINPVRDRELDLRGYKIPVIENLGTTLDQACLVQNYFIIGYLIFIDQSSDVSTLDLWHYPMKLDP